MSSSPNPDDLFTPRQHNISSSFQSPNISKLDRPILEASFKELLQVLKVQDEDLKLAAEIGKSLLESKENLQNELQSLKESHSVSPLPNTPNSNAVGKKNSSSEEAHIQSLEKANAKLDNKLKSTESELDELKLTYSKNLKRLQVDNQGSKEEIAVLSERVAELERSQHRLTDERNSLKSQLASKEMRLSSGNSNADLQEFETILLALGEEKQELEREFGAAKQLLESTCEQNEDLKNEIQELNISLADMDHKNIEIQHLQQALEESQVFISQLMNQTASVSVASSAAVGEGRTLFSEVEDRRIELESQHSKLSNKHLGLLKTHSETIQQQERMKNHISRLTQLTSSSGSDAKIKRIEQKMAQLESENRFLQNKLMSMERDYARNEPTIPTDAVSQIITEFENDTFENSVKIYMDQIETLRHQIEKLKKESRTLALLRASESEKCKQYEHKLSDIESENRKIKAQLAHTQFELDEMKMGDKLKDIATEVETFQNENANYINVADVQLPEPLVSTGKSENNVEESKNIAKHIQLVDHQVAQVVIPPQASADSEGPKEIQINRENVNQCNQQ